jgi:hypothetical protein
VGGGVATCGHMAGDMSGRRARANLNERAIYGYRVHDHVSLMTSGCALGELVEDQLDVRATLEGADRVHKADLRHDARVGQMCRNTASGKRAVRARPSKRLEVAPRAAPPHLRKLAVGGADHDFPACSDFFVYTRRARVLGAEVEADIVLKCPNINARAVIEDFDGGTQHAGEVKRALAHQGNNVSLQVVHAETLEVGQELDACPVVARLAGRDARLAFLTHVVRENLAVPFLPGPVAGLDDELGGENVGELGAIAVSPSGHLE